MNIELLQQFGQSFPEEFDGILDSISLAGTCAFNRRGTLLAVGCNDGRIVIWDFLTRGIAKIITAHVHPVCSLCFSRRGTAIVSASTDNTVCVFDVSSSDCVAKWKFPAPIMKVQYNPRNDNAILVCPTRHPAVVVRVPKDGDNRSHTILPLDEDADPNITASFDRRGQMIYTGNSRGRIVVIKLDGEQPEIVASFRIGTANTAIKQIEFAPKRKDVFLVNTADRVIRVYECREVLACGLNGEPEPVQKLQDLVNKTMWKKCCFSGGPDAEYICAGSARQHSIYIWERSVGTLVKILHGTKGEMLLDVIWHPMRPIIASISSGVVSVWAQAQVENWSAFAPDFKELDENVEYEERESEFDLEDEDRSPARVAQEKDEEDEEVDVETSHPTDFYLSSDEDEDAEKNDLLYLPITLEVDEPETIDPGIGLPNSQPPSDPNTPTKSSNRVKTVDINLDPTKEPSNRQRSERSSLNNKNFRTGNKRSSTVSQEIPPKRKKRPGYDD